MSRVIAVVVGIATLALAVYGGYRQGMSHGASTTSGPATERKALYWYDPMEPAQHFDKPGKSPFMDMELVPKYADEEQQGTVSIDPRMVQNLGVRTAKVERGGAAQRLDTVGNVEADERRMFTVEARAAGWVEQLLVRSSGDPVKRGQRIAGIYSPDLYAVQEELVLASKTHDANLVAASRQKASLLGLADAQLDEIQNSGKAQRLAWVVAPSDGIVTELNVRQGAQVAPGMALARVADLSKVWIVAEIPEAQAGAVHVGAGAEARVAALSGQAFHGKVEYIYPRLETATRTVRARVTFDNAALTLKPGMFAQLLLDAGAASSELLIPSEALIRTGTRTVVIVAEGEGRFRPVAVSVGAEHGDKIAVLSGLDEGQQVVTSGQFLIDSEASLRGAFTRLGEGEKAP